MSTLHNTVGRRFAAALIPRLFGKPRSHYKGATGRVRTGDQLLPVLCHCQLGQDSISVCNIAKIEQYWHQYMKNLNCHWLQPEGCLSLIAGLQIHLEPWYPRFDIWNHETYVFIYKWSYEFIVYMNLYMNSYVWIYIHKNSHMKWSHEFIVYMNSYIHLYEFIYEMNIWIHEHMNSCIWILCIDSEFVREFISIRVQIYQLILVSNLISSIWFHKYEFMTWIHYWKQNHEVKCMISRYSSWSWIHL